ncbi:MAG: NADH-quinone oxidoreductase subunit J [Elusimicrobiota bacterium]
MLRDIFFYIFSAIAIFSSLYILFARNPVRAAFSMFLVFFSTGVIYLLMGLTFLGAVQIIIYAGAIMALFVVALPAMSKAGETPSKKISFKGLAGLLSAALFLSLLFPLAFMQTGHFILPHSFNLKDFASSLFSKYWMQLEIISLLLFVAIAAAYTFYLEKSGGRDEQ